MFGTKRPNLTEQDVRNEGRWSEIVAQAEKAYGRLDILSNIAGISGRDPKLNIQTGHTVFMNPGVIRGFNPQPDPPGFGEIPQ